jgi:hypothetical protein
MQSFEALVKRLVKAFNAARLDYMLTGALAASYYGTPRTTTDVDIIVKVNEEDIRAKVIPTLKKAGLLVKKDDIETALKSGYRIASLNDAESPFKLDLILSKEMLRKKAGSIFGLPTYYQRPEDLILAKMRMVKATVPRERALKDVEDAKSILKFTKVDIDAVRKGAQKDSTTEILDVLLKDLAG